jgi:hypothetical protein
MPKPTTEEIRVELEMLRAMRLKPISHRKRHEEIDAMIDALAGEIDPTTPEFEEMADHERDAANDALMWKDGLTAKRPTGTF